MSEKQTLARKRNNLKMRLTGATHIFSTRHESNIYTEYEAARVNHINDEIDHLLRYWDDGNRELGLNPKVKDGKNKS